MKNVRLIIEYDGTNYHGWQIQKNAVGVQDVLQQAISWVTNEETTLMGSSRTDAGVHAWGQVANFFTKSTIPAEKWTHVLNTRLPQDIVIHDSTEVPITFNARFSNIGKTYFYRVRNTYFPSALERNRSYHIREKINIEAMQNAARLFLGTHDFSAFRSSKCTAKNTWKTLTHFTVEKKMDDIQFTITGDSFLQNMVRILVGTLLDVGKGSIQADHILDILRSKDRKNAGKTVPPQGLYLHSVHY